MSFLVLFNYVATHMGQLLSKIPVVYNLWYPQSIRHAKSVGKITPTLEQDEVPIDDPDEPYCLDTDNVPDSMYNYEEELSGTPVNCALASPDHVEQKDAPILADISILVDGFIEETNLGVQTDKTSQARDATTGDLNLCPANDAVNGKIYIGSDNPFWRVWLAYLVAGVGSWANSLYYWNGAWTAVVGGDDATNNFQNPAGTRRITHTPQGDWAKTTILAKNQYWLKVETTSYTSRTTKPLGSQVWVSVA